MQTSGNILYIIEDDQSVRDALGLTLGLHGYAVAMYSDAESFLQAYRPEWRGCLLIDIRMPGMDGLTLQARLQELECRMPAIIMTGHGDVESARAAFRARAVDFIEKPIDQARLVAAIDESFRAQGELREREGRHAEFEAQLSTLTPREREVMALVVAGRPNREVAQQLDISVRTVEVHKARLLAKLRAKNVPDLVRLSFGGGMTHSTGAGVNGPAQAE